ncbi:MAG: AAA family ATPase [Desulfurococcaceae archaeon]
MEVELVGISKNLEAMRIWLEDWKVGIQPAKKMMVLVGPPGVGKTSSVYKVSSELGFEVCELNMSDNRDKDFFEKLYSRLQAKPIVPTVFLLDEGDGVEDKEALVKVLKVTKNPVFLTANDFGQLPKSIRENAIVLKFQPINVRDVLKLVGEVRDYSAVGGDVRQSLLAKFGSQGYKAETNPVKDFLNGELKDVERWVLITILDNAHRWVYGFELYQLVKAIVVADKTRRPDPLNYFKGVGRDWEKSYFYDKVSASR